MPYTLDTLPNHIQNNLSEDERRLWLDVFNATYAETQDDTASMQAAWGAVRKAAMLVSIKSVKGEDCVVCAWGMLFTDEETRDLDNEFFEDATQTLLEYYKGAPLWYEHGVDPVYGVKPIGKRLLVKVHPRGIYTEHELHPDHPHLQRTLEEIERGELTLSSDSLSQYWVQDRDGRNISWPIAGWSLTKTPAEPALGAAVLKSFIKTFHRDFTGIAQTEAREVQGTRGTPANQIVQISSKGNIMNEEMLAQLAAFLGLDSADPAVLATRLRELAASLEGTTEMTDEQAQAVEAKAEGDVTEEEEQALETSKLVVTIKTALGLDAKASYADVADELRVIAKAVKNFNAQPLLNGEALNQFGGAWKAAKHTPEADMPYAANDNNSDGDNGGANQRNGNHRGGSGRNTHRQPAKSRSYGRFGIQNGGGGKVGVGRILQEFYAYTMNRTPMKSQSYQLGSVGGLLLRHEISNDFIETLRDKLILEQLGADFVPMDGMETLTLPKDNTEVEAYWVGDGMEIPDSEETVGGITLYPKALAVRIIVPTKFLANSRVNYESRIEAQAQYRIDRKLLYAALFGAGGVSGSNTGVEPAGLLTISGMSGRSLTKTELGSGNGLKPTLAHIEDMIGRVEDANVEDDGSAGFALSPRAKRFFGNMKDADGNYVLRARASEAMDPNFLGYPYADSNIIPNNTTVGSNSDNTTLFYGVWSNLKVGMSNHVEFFLDPYSRSARLQTVIIAHIFADVNVAHDEAFEVVTGARV